jgi:tetratricopeptide (TPR) repeat protein
MSVPPPSEASPTPLRERRRGGVRAGGSGWWRGAIVVSLVALTAWNVTRSDALAKARTADKRGERAECLEYALDHLDRQPWNREAALLAARSLSQLDYADDAEPYYRRAGALSIADLHTRAYALLRRGRLDDAIRLYNEVLALAPNNITALRRLAAIYLTQNNNDALMALADRLNKLPEGVPIGYTLLGAVQHHNDNHEMAVAAFERVLKEDPQLKVMPLPRQLFWTEFCSDLMSIGRFDDACRYLARAVDEMPDPTLLDFLGRAYELNGMLDEAERCWQKSAQNDRRTYLPLLNLGKLAARRKQYSEAIDYLTRAEQLAPDHGDVCYQLGLVYHFVGNEAAAARYRKKLEELRRKAAPAAAPSNSALPAYAL